MKYILEEQMAECSLKSIMTKEIDKIMTAIQPHNL